MCRIMPVNAAISYAVFQMLIFCLQELYIQSVGTLYPTCQRLYPARWVYMSCTLEVYSLHVRHPFPTKSTFIL